MRPWIISLLLIAGCAANPAAKPSADIDSFQGQYRFLSNFYPCEIQFEGITYPSVEHAYQSAKTQDSVERRRIAAMATPADAKAAGRLLRYRPDWERAKYDVMLVCVRYKFTRHPELAQQLLETGDAHLEEGNTWNDQIWGVYEGKGTNWLGKILMQVRSEIRYTPVNESQIH